MTRPQIVAIVGLSLGWLFILAGMAMNFISWRAGLRAKEGDPVPSGVLFIFGILGAVLAYNTIEVIEKHFAVSVPWPWLWTVLPLFLDMYCAGGLMLALFGVARRENADGTR